MARKYRIAAAGAIAVVAVAGALLTAAYYAAQQVQPFYVEALQLEPEVLQRESRELESRATALFSDARQQGRWQALFTADQINGWLATQLAANEDGLPRNFRDPRVAITKEALTLGFRTTSRGVETVVTVDAGVFLTEEGAVGLRLMSVRAGALPLPVLRIADELATACQRLELPVRWAHQQGEPIALIEMHGDPESDKPQLYIDSIELGDSELYVAGHTEFSSAHDISKMRIPGAGKLRSHAIALEDYELRLTPNHKDGPLQIARRKAKSEPSQTRDEETRESN